MLQEPYAAYLFSYFEILVSELLMKLFQTSFVCENQIFSCHNKVFGCDNQIFGCHEPRPSKTNFKNEFMVKKIPITK